MTGPEHYREAEQLLSYVQNSGPDPAGELIAAAQVHATLALAAAMAPSSVSVEHVSELPHRTDPRQRLASLMESRRKDLRLRWVDVAADGDVSIKSLHNARTGTMEIRPLTQRAIEVGLQWPAGTIQRILDGDTKAGATRQFGGAA